MSNNMSYCRFRNSAIDLDDCVSTLEDIVEGNNDPREELSADEYRAFSRMVNVCEQFLELAEATEEIMYDNDNRKKDDE